jgi:photosystem II stability/assembly factor-like uncharacterized protein
MKKFFSVIVFSVILFSQLQAQESTIYVSVLTNRLFVVGATNSQTGVYYQRPSEDTTWHHLGARNIRAFGLAVHTPARGQLIYIASGNGAHRTLDGGKNWKVTTGWEITEVLAVCIDPRDEKTVYLATAYGIYKTSDGGASWQQVNRGLVDPFSTCVIVDHAHSNVVYCATEGGVFASSDGAQSWQRLGLSVANIRVLAQHPRDPQMLVAGTENNGIYISRDGGKVWTKSDAGVDHNAFYAIVFDPNQPEIMYAGGYVSGVYKSTNGGKSWVGYHEGLPNLNIHSLAVDPANSNRVYAGTIWSGIFRSDNGGVTWRQAGLSGAQVWRISMQPF